MENKTRVKGQRSRVKKVIEQQSSRAAEQQFKQKNSTTLLRYCATALILLFTIHCSLFTDLSFAQEKKDGPTIITSQSLTTDNKAKTALFEGSVIARKGDTTIFADKMLVYYSDEKGGSNIKKIEAEGNVKVLKGERVITSKFATYFAEPVEHIVFTGEPRAIEGENVVTGTKMTFFMKDDRSVVENSRVFLKSK